jgi:hypothetical protein
MNKATGRKVGLICGINDWTKHLHRSLLKRMNSKKVRKNIKKLD